MRGQELQGLKTTGFHGPATVATDATSQVYVDTLGFDYAVIDVVHNPCTTLKWGALQLLHGTSEDATNHTTLAGGVGTTNTTATTNQFLINAHNNTSKAGITRFFVSLEDKERYLSVKHTAPTGMNTVCAFAHLIEGDEVPDSLTLRNVTNQAFVL